MKSMGGFSALELIITISISAFIVVPMINTLKHGSNVSESMSSFNELVELSQTLNTSFNRNNCYDILKDIDLSSPSIQNIDLNKIPELSKFSNSSIELNVSPIASENSLIFEIGKTGSNKKISIPIRVNIDQSNFSLVDCSSVGISQTNNEAQQPLCSKDGCLSELKCDLGLEFSGFEIINGEFKPLCNNLNSVSNQETSSCPPILKKVKELSCDEQCFMGVEYECAGNPICLTDPDLKCLANGKNYSQGDTVILKKLGNCNVGEGNCGKDDDLLRYCGVKSTSSYYGISHQIIETSKDQESSFDSFFTCPLNQSCFPSPLGSYFFKNPSAAIKTEDDILGVSATKSTLPTTCSSLKSISCENSLGEKWECPVDKRVDPLKKTCWSGDSINATIPAYQVFMKELFQRDPSLSIAASTENAIKAAEKKILSEYSNAKLLHYCGYGTPGAQEIIDLFKSQLGKSSDGSEFFEKDFISKTEEFLKSYTCGDLKGSCDY